jgi:hypothetical protein
MVSVLASGAAWGQELRGSVRGVVSDSTGGVVLRAKVTLRSTGTGVQTERDTNTNGQFFSTS